MIVSTVEMADPKPTLGSSKKVWYEKYDGTLVALSGPPRVRAKIGPNTFIAAIVQVKATTKVSGRICGTVIARNRRNQPAPSSSAASYSSGSTRCSAAMKITTG